MKKFNKKLLHECSNCGCRRYTPCKCKKANPNSKRSKKRRTKEKGKETK